MVNEDGTVGGHWTLDQTTSVAKAKGIRFDAFNEFDWCYVMNMLYSDYYGTVPDSTDTYASMARAFLMDKDAPKGKAMLYHDAMCQR